MYAGVPIDGAGGGVADARASAPVRRRGRRVRLRGAGAQVLGQAPVDDDGLAERADQHVAPA